MKVSHQRESFPISDNLISSYPVTKWVVFVAIGCYYVKLWLTTKSNMNGLDYFGTSGLSDHQLEKQNPTPALSLHGMLWL